MEYDFTKIEKKWQDYWERNKTFKTPDFSEKKSFMSLTCFLIRVVRDFMSGIRKDIPRPISTAVSNA